MKTVAVLGSTGSIGTSTLKVISSDASLRVGLLANANDLYGLKRQIEIYHPSIAVCVNQGYLYRDGKEYKFDKNPLFDADVYSECDIVVNGIVGLAGLMPSLAVLKCGKILATANKESLVCAGTLINALKETTSGKIYPVDSEHSAIWQLSDGRRDIKDIIITASGGAFRDLTREQLTVAKAEDALRHPNWLMGKKVTIDCATLLNKGMEIIEAKHLFGQPAAIIGHRQSVVHGIIRFADGSLQANLSTPDMITPIAYALYYPEIKPVPVEELDLAKLQRLDFFELDESKFPCLKLARRALYAGDIASCILNSADEILVDRYLRGDIGFYDISDGIEAALDKFATNGNFDCVEAVFRMDKAVKEYTLSMQFGGR